MVQLWLCIGTTCQCTTTAAECAPTCTECLLSNVLQPVCELLLHVLLLVINREGQSFNIQRAEVKTSVRNKVSTVGTIYNFHTIYFLFFLSSSIHGKWCCPQMLVLVLAHVLAKKHSAVLMLLRLCTLSPTTPHHNCALVAPVVQKKIQYEKYRLQLQWTALIVCNTQFQFSPQQLKQEPTDWLGYIFLTQPGRQGVWSCHHHHYLPPLTHNFSVQLMHSIMHIKHCAVGIWRTAGVASLHWLKTPSQKVNAYTNRHHCDTIN